MKILEELKAAQETIAESDGYFDLELGVIDCNDSGGANIAAVLRRIPQLIEVVELLEAYASLGRDGAVLDNKYVQRQHFAVDLLSKLEGKKDE